MRVYENVPLQVIYIVPKNIYTFLVWCIMKVSFLKNFGGRENGRFVFVWDKIRVFKLVRRGYV